MRHAALDFHRGAWRVFGGL